NLAAECTRCRKPFCPMCKGFGEPALYCSDCVRLYLRKESPGIEAHVAQARESRWRIRRRDWSCRLVSLLLPGTHLGLSEKPMASFWTLFLFLLFVAIAGMGTHFSDLNGLPPAGRWPALTPAALLLAAIV